MPNVVLVRVLIVIERGDCLSRANKVCEWLVVVNNRSVRACRSSLMSVAESIAVYGLNMSLTSVMTQSRSKANGSERTPKRS